MSRSISQDIIDALEASEITAFHLLQFTIDETTYYYTDCEVNIRYAVDGTNSQTYQARAFTIDDISYSNDSIVDSCNVTIDNLDSVLTALFLDNVVDDESLKLYTILFDSDNSVIGCQGIFNGFIGDFDWDESQVRLSAISLFKKWDQISTSKHTPLCRWKQFGGTECGYSGDETSCNREYSRCEQLNNTENFGGFRWLPKIEDLEVWWGPKPSEQ